MRRWACILSCAIVLTTGLWAQRALSLEDYYNQQAVGSLDLSPDGLWVAFVKTRILEQDNRRHSEVWLVPSSGARPPRRITSPSFSSSNPGWSPDGKLLSFSSRRPLPGKDRADSSVWFLSLEAPAEAFQIEGVKGAPIFSPDNKWIAFTRAAQRLKKDPLGTEFEKRIEDRFEGRIYDWMNFRFDRRGYLPDPRSEAASPSREIYLLPRQGGGPKILTRLGVSASTPSWSPDSRQLAFSADTHARDEHSYERADLFVVDLEGKKRRLTDDGYHSTSPVWSPDGRMIAFLRRRSLDMVIEAGQQNGAPLDIFQMPAQGGQPVNLTSHLDIRPQNLAWHPQGQEIYFLLAKGGNRHIYRLELKTRRIEAVTEGERSLGSVDLADDFQTIGYTASDSSRPNEVFVLAGGQEKQLTSVAKEWLFEVKLSRAERIQYPSKDGTPIEGWVLKPYGFQSGRSHPLVVTIHGGPHSAYGDRFSFHHQLLAASGYLVLYTNPRGSTGYGEEFMWATWGGGWGNLDYEDIMAGVDYTIGNYPVDSARMGVTGGSYGGFMTNWVITHTGRFAAAVARASISNWISDYGTADIPRTKESEFNGPPWIKESAELLWRQSPIRYAKNVTTPTLFIHGEIDYRVPIEQAEQMYTALRKQKVAARFIRYPESYHGGWTPWRELHRTLHELKWWEKYLK